MVRKRKADPVVSLDKSPSKDLSEKLVSSLDPRTKTPFKWGQVRATPYGSCLDTIQRGKDASEWNKFRSDYLKPLNPPREGADHVYGQPTIDKVDGTDLGTSVSSSQTISDSELKHSHDFGSTKTPDDAPIGSLKDKWRMVPHFLKLRSLMRQHIDSFDHFVNIDLKKIVQSESAREI